MSEQESINIAGAAKLSLVNPRLVAVVWRAARISKQPFIVLEGVRTRQRQRDLVAQGKSQTLQSKHLAGQAVDIAPLVDGQPSWDWQYYWEVARAMDQAADELGVTLTWGAAWNGTNNVWDDPKQAVEEYKRIRRAQRRGVFLDGVHWEI